jgi:hypothetical protein
MSRIVIVVFTKVVSVHVIAASTYNRLLHCSSTGTHLRSRYTTRYNSPILEYVTEQEHFRRRMVIHSKVETRYRVGG